MSVRKSTLAVATYIYHVPLQSGTARHLYRAEMPAELLEEQVELIRLSLESGPKLVHPIPRLPGYLFAASGSCCVAQFGVYSLATRGPVLRGGLAMKCQEHRATVTALWCEMIATSELPVHPAVHHQPKTPWYATQLDPRTEEMPAYELRDVEEYARCLPWAWVEYHRRIGQVKARSI